jgi:hypothetical protein
LVLMAFARELLAAGEIDSQGSADDVSEDK